MMRPFGPQCSVHFPTNGGNDETNRYFIGGGHAIHVICRGAVHFVPSGLYRYYRGTHDHRQQFMPAEPYIRRHRNQLPCVQPRRVVYYVRPSGCIIYRRHRDIRIHRGMCYGINHPGLRPPLRRGELGLRPVAEPVPLHWRGGM